MKLKGNRIIDINNSFESDTKFIILKLEQLFKIMNFKTAIDSSEIKFKKNIFHPQPEPHIHSDYFLKDYIY